MHPNIMMIYLIPVDDPKFGPPVLFIVPYSRP